MFEDEQPRAEKPRKKKKTLSNIVYSILVFFASFFLGLAVVAATTPSSSGDTSQITSRAFLAIGLSFVLTIGFSLSYAKKHDR